MFEIDPVRQKVFPQEMGKRIWDALPQGLPQLEIRDSIRDAVV